MAQLKVEILVKDLEAFKLLSSTLIELVADERIEKSVREEYQGKMRSILDIKSPSNAYERAGELNE